MGVLRSGILLSTGIVGGVCGFYYWTFGGTIEEDVKPIGEIRQRLYRSLPLRTFSRFVGTAMEVPIPSPLREGIYRSYCSTFGCNVEESEKNPREYSSVANFFARSLQDGARPVSTEGLLVAPCDGRILSLGRVTANGSIDQVKGMSYGVRDLLCLPGDDPLAVNAVNVGEGVAGKVQASNYGLYYATIYLAPGDYHGFHAPAEWDVRRRRHIAGELLSVAPNVLKRVHGVFRRNERVVLGGRWEYGMLSLVAVGATSVGSVRVDFDATLATNRASDEYGKIKTHFFGAPGHELKRGERVGGFRLGSCIVLVFEAPDNFDFSIARGDRVRMGESIGILARA